MGSAHFEWYGLVFFAVLAVLPLAPAVPLLGRIIRAKDASDRKWAIIRFAIATDVAFFIYVGVAVDAFIIEPDWPELNAFEIEGKVDKPLQILHLSDLHLEPGIIKRQEWLKEQLRTLKPDLILLTGDTHQLDNFDPESFKPVLSLLKAPLGVYGCVGNDNVELLNQANPEIKWLENETVILTHGNDRVDVTGLVQIAGREQAYEKMRSADYRIVINHTPELADEAAEQGADLYLCGHTHGGQIRIPFWGAIITNSATGKKYESGLAKSGSTYIFTNRGLGLEPRPAPQARFFCRPEIALVTVNPLASR